MNPQRLDILIHAYLDGVQSQAERAEMERELRSDAEARQRFWELGAAHAFLGEAIKFKWGGLEDSIGVAPASVPFGSAGAKTANPKTTAEKSRTATAADPAFPVGTLGFLTTAVQWVPGGQFTVGSLLLLAVFSAFWGVVNWVNQGPFPFAALVGDQRPAAAPAAQPAAPVVAHWKRAADCRWGAEVPGGEFVPSAPPNDQIRAGQTLALLSGVADFEFVDGAGVLVEGPCSITFETTWRMALRRGRLAARVPRGAEGFTVATPNAEVVDLGTEFGVEVDRRGATDLHVLRGKVVVRTVADKAPARSTQVSAGQAVRIRADGTTTNIAPDPERFTATRLERSAGRLKNVAPSIPAVDPAAGPVDKIYLARLFDDPAGTSLASAMATNTVHATPEISDLGVERVLYAGEPVKLIAPRVRFDFGNVGWSDLSCGMIETDWLVAGGAPLRTTGRPLPEDQRPANGIEHGIGVHANALVTFDLQKLRAAGKLGEARLQFVCERVGVNDGALERPESSLHVMAVVSSGSGVQAAALDGALADVAQRSGVWSITSPVGSPLRADGKFARFALPIPAESRYLTLVVTSAGNDHSMDHAAWLEPRLEVVLPAEDPVPR